MMLDAYLESYIPDHNPFRKGLAIERSLQGLPPITKSKGPNSFNCTLKKRMKQRESKIKSKVTKSLPEKDSMKSSKKQTAFITTNHFIIYFTHVSNASRRARMTSFRDANRVVVDFRCMITFNFNV